MRRMSFALTTDAVRAQTKTVTRRLGWTFLKPGDRLLAVDKIRTKNAQRLSVIEVVSVSREPLGDIEQLSIEDGRAEVRREGSPLPPDHRCGRCNGEYHDCPSCFANIFLKLGAARCTIVTRIEFRYIDEGAG
jgi:hypothetical protein